MSAPIKSLGQIVSRRQSNEARARETTALLGALPSEDLARSSYETAAVVFALLAINDTLAATVLRPPTAGKGET